MSNQLFWGILVLIIILALGVFIYSIGGTSNTITVPLTEQNGSGEFGTTVLTEEEGLKTNVKISLFGAPGFGQPAHIHTGTCANPGPVVYSLNPPVSGASETMLDVSLDQIMTELPLIINVHKSVSEIGVYVSCGEIPRR